ncbi:hypothetical protein GQ55_9G201300 [Panicum hallii var. hallii]|uniref:Uncharacterized protein n=1 Tax=Panicum hallii var. hallii TaxID=1504633 RepID=A0A2T7C579_9POAL|nr:hypothetical protein GQ55_9G201300 [Panicum hallii var. hallii]
MNSERPSVLFLSNSNNVIQYATICTQDEHDGVGWSARVRAKTTPPGALCPKESIRNEATLSPNPDSQQESQRNLGARQHERNRKSQLEAELAVAGLDLDGAADVHDPVDDEVAAHPGGDLPQFEAPQLDAHGHVGAEHQRHGPVPLRVPHPGHGGAGQLHLPGHGERQHRGVAAALVEGRQRAPRQGVRAVPHAQAGPALVVHADARVRVRRRHRHVERRPRRERGRVDLERGHGQAVHRVPRRLGLEDQVQRGRGRRGEDGQHGRGGDDAAEEAAAAAAAAALRRRKGRRRRHAARRRGKRAVPVAAVAPLLLVVRALRRVALVRPERAAVHQRRRRAVPAGLQVDRVDPLVVPHGRTSTAAAATRTTRLFSAAEARSR